MGIYNQILPPQSATSMDRNRMCKPKVSPGESLRFHDYPLFPFQTDVWAHSIVLHNSLTLLLPYTPLVPQNLKSYIYFESRSQSSARELQLFVLLKVDQLELSIPNHGELVIKKNIMLLVHSYKFILFLCKFNFLIEYLSFTYIPNPLKMYLIVDSIQLGLVGMVPRTAEVVR